MAQQFSFSGMIPSSRTPQSEKGRSRRNLRHSHQTKTYVITACYCCFLFSCTAAFSPLVSISSALSVQHCTHTIVTTYHTTTTRLYNQIPEDDLSPNDDVDKDPVLDDEDPFAAQIRKAKELLSVSKKKLKSQEEAAAKAGEGKEEGTALPFFATNSAPSSDIENAKKIKSKTSTGEIIADGELMASLSNSEPWEARSFSEMKFDEEARTDYDGNIVKPGKGRKNTMADLNMAASIFNLRTKLQNGDFMKVFDKRNRFIGDLD